MSNLGARFVLPYQTVIDNTGVPLPGALLFFYASGTDDPLSTYSNQALTIPNTNPVVANAAGRFPNIFLQNAEYKVVLQNADGVEIWTADPVTDMIFGNGVDFYSFDTTTDLLAAFGALVTLAPYSQASTTGRTVAGGLGGATFFYNAADTTTADNGGTIRVDGQGRRWYTLDYAKGTQAVTLFGATGDGVTDDRGAIQACIDYLLSFPLAASKVCLFPKVAVGYYVNSGQTIHQKYPLSNNGSGYINAFFFANAKNLTFRGEGEGIGGAKLIAGPNYQTVVGNRFFVAATDVNFPFFNYDPAQTYNASLLAHIPQANPIVPGNNWMTLKQGDISLFPVGDLVNFLGVNTITAVEKIIDVDLATGKIYFERPIYLKLANIDFPAVATAQAGATKIYVECFNWFRGYQDNAPSAQINITLDDSSILTTYVTGTGLDGNTNGGNFITIHDAIPGGRTVPAGNNIEMAGSGAFGLIQAASETALKYFYANQLKTSGGAIVYPYVTVNDTFWGVTPENVTFDNIEIDGAWFGTWFSHTYNFTLKNCRFSAQGDLILWGTTNGFNVIDCDFIQTEGTSGGLQLSPASQRYCTFERCNFVCRGAGVSENSDTIAFTDCSFTPSADWNKTPSTSGFLSSFATRDVVYTRCKIIVGAGYPATAAGQSGFIQTWPIGGPYAGQDSVIFRDCDFVYEPGVNAGGIEQESYFAVVAFNTAYLAFEDCRWNIRYCYQLYTGGASQLVFKNNFVNMVDVGTTKGTFFTPGPSNLPVLINPSGISEVSGNTFIYSALNKALATGAFYTFSWTWNAVDLGYWTASIHDNLYNGFKKLYAVSEGLTDNGERLADISIYGEKTINNQAAFATSVNGSGTIIPIGQTDPDGIRTWYTRQDPATIKGGIVQLGDAVIQRNGGAIVTTVHCTTAGGITTGNWSNVTNYLTDQWVTGSDAKIYVSLQASGPAGVGAKDPTTPNPLYWRLVANVAAVLA